MFGRLGAASARRIAKNSHDDARSERLKLRAIFCDLIDQNRSASSSLVIQLALYLN